MKKIIVGSEIILIDSASLEKIRQFSKNKFNITKDRKGNKYVVIKKAVDGVIYSCMASKIIISLNKGEYVKHIDGNTMNLSIKNLIAAPKTTANRTKRAAKTLSKYIGVSFCKAANKWRVQIKPSTILPNKHIGYFLTEDEAAEAYNEAAKKFHGNFAKLNIIK